MQWLQQPFHVCPLRFVSRLSSASLAVSYFPLAWKGISTTGNQSDLSILGSAMWQCGFLIGMESSCWTAETLSMLLRCVQISPWIRGGEGGFNRVRVQRVQPLYFYHHYICTLSLTRSGPIFFFFTFLSPYHCIFSSPLLAPDWPDCISTVESLKMLCGAFWCCWCLHLVLLTQKHCVRLWDLTYISFLIKHFHTRLFTDIKFSIVSHPCLLSCALLPCLSWCVAVYLVTCWSVE